MLEKRIPLLSIALKSKSNEKITLVKDSILIREDEDNAKLLNSKLLHCFEKKYFWNLLAFFISGVVGNVVLNSSI